MSANQVIPAIMAQMPGKIIAADAPDSEFNVTPTYTTLFTKDVRLAVNDQLILDVIAGASASSDSNTFGYGLTIGGVTVDLSHSTSVTANPNRSPRWVQCVVSVGAVDRAGLLCWMLSSDSMAANGNSTLSSGFSGYLWQTSSSDFTGVQTVAFKARTPSNTGTRKCYLYGYVMRLIRGTP